MRYFTFGDISGKRKNRDTYLYYRVRRFGLGFFGRSSGLAGRVDSCLGFVLVGLDCSSFEGRGIGWRIWCLRSKV